MENIPLFVEERELEESPENESEVVERIKEVIEFRVRPFV